MEILVGRVFAGHLRSIVGGLTVEQIIRERDRVAQEIKDGSHAEMEKLGIVVDALEIQEIEDSSGYINNLAAPHAAAVASQARIAKAQGRPGGHRAGAGGCRDEGPVRAGHRDQAGRVPRRDRAGQGPGRAGRAARRGAGLAGGHPAADRAAQRRPNWPRSASRPRSAARPTPRRTGSARSPRQPGTRPGSRPRRRRTGTSRSPRPRPRRPGSGPMPARTRSAPPAKARPTRTVPGPRRCARATRSSSPPTPGGGPARPGRGGRPRPGRCQPDHPERHPGGQRGHRRPGRPGPVDLRHADPDHPSGPAAQPPRQHRASTPPPRPRKANHAPRPARSGRITLPAARATGQRSRASRPGPRRPRRDINVP